MSSHLDKQDTPLAPQPSSHSKECSSYELSSLQITPLFATDYGDDIILSSRLGDKTIFVRLYNIRRFMLIAKVPGMTCSEFENFLRACGYSIFKKVLMFEPNTSCLGQKYTYYKIYGTKQTLLDDAKYKDETQYGKFKTIFTKNNYLTPDIEAEQKIYDISEFYKKWLNHYHQHQRNTLTGIDYHVYPYIKYPFRCVKQDVATIQYKYNINFFDTIEFPLSAAQCFTNLEKYNCDEIYFVDIANVKQSTQSKLYEHIKDYRAIMFDIENYVYIPMQHNNQPPTFTLIPNPPQDVDDKNYYCDEQQIICISFVEQDFAGNILSKTALVRTDGFEDFGDLKQKLNFDYVENKQTVNDYCDKIITVTSEKELLQKTIDILTDKKYHIIQHFNGWKFDERMLMIRFSAYGLLDEYLYRLQTIRSHTSYTQYFTNEGTFKVTAERTAFNLCQLTDPLKFSLDVCQINLRDSVDAQKHDDNSLNSLLKLHNLGLKGDVSYEQLNIWFHNRDSQIIKGYWYCQRDSIQQCKLQGVLKIILNGVQFTNLCQIPLRDSIQKAVGTKVCAMLQRYYYNHDTAVNDTLIPYMQGQPIYEKGKAKQLTNIGGEVICFRPGFDKYISAVDASSMYPAQVEANNISNSSMLYPTEMIYVLTHLKAFGFQGYNVEYLLDMYSPYSQYKHIEMLDNAITNTITNLYYTDIKKFPRYRIAIACGDDNLVFEQFFFAKAEMSPIYNYVFYQQGKDVNPRAQMLTSLRFLRKGVKKQLKAATDVNERAFLDGKQLAIKIVMNSTYGASDAVVYPAYELIGPSVITQSSRFIIQNCRDNLQHQVFTLPQFIIDAITPYVDSYNAFVNKTIQDPTPLLITHQNDIYSFPQIAMKYQDTDSNYIIMPMLDEVKVFDRYKNDERYIKSQIFANFNDMFCVFINTSMNKFPLAFDFEGAFYRAWHIQCKTYLGQKITPPYCKLNDDGSLMYLSPIEETINLQGFDADKDDIYTYLAEKHLKITGLGLIKRNTTLLLKRYYLKLIEYVLNEFKVDLIDVIKKLKDEITLVPINQFFQPKKIKQTDFDKSYVIRYNTTHDIKLGLGEVMYTVLSTPYACDKFQYIKYSAEDQKVVIKDTNDKVDIYYAHYIYQVYKNLMVFLYPDADEKLVKIHLDENKILSFGQVQGVYRQDNQDQLITIFVQWLHTDRLHNVILIDGITWKIERVYKKLKEIYDKTDNYQIGQLLLQYIEHK